MHEVLVNRLGGLSLPRKSVVRLSDRPDMTSDVYRGRKTTIQQQQGPIECGISIYHARGLCILLVTRENFQGKYRQNSRSGGSVVDNRQDYQSKDRKIDPPLLQSFG